METGVLDDTVVRGTVGILDELILGLVVGVDVGIFDELVVGDTVRVVDGK